MGKRKTTTISLLTLSIIGMTAFTGGHLPKSSSFSPTYALAQPAGPVATSFEKYNGTSQAYSEALKKELGDVTDLRIWELGLSNFKEQNVKVSDLASKISDDYKVVTIDGKLHRDRVVFIVKKDDILVNNQSDYEAKTKDIRQKVGTFGVHSLFDLKKDNYLDIILGSNGLRKTLGTYNGINGLTLHSNTLGLANTYTEQYENSEITLEKIKDNDKKLLEMLKESGAAHAPTEREKVKRWVIYLKKKIPYDFDALKVYRTDRQSYNISSDLFSVATRKKAMCVGYSIATARAMNLLGLPSYMVEGVTKNGALHATTRVFFDNAWHLVDSTGGGADENQSEYYYDFYFKNSLDQYKNVTQAEKKYNDRNYMVINKEFEEWAKGQSTAKLLYVNAEAALRERVPLVVSQEIREKFKTVNEKLRNDFETFKAAAQSNDSLKERIAGLISSIDEDQKKISSDKVTTEEDYKILNSALSTNIIFYNELQRALSPSMPSQFTAYESIIRDIENKFIDEKKYFEKVHKTELDKVRESEEKAKQEEAKYLAQRSQRSSTILTAEDREKLEKRIKEESQKLDNTMSEAAHREFSSTEQAKPVSSASPTASRAPQAHPKSESESPKIRVRRALAPQEPTVSPTSARPAPAPAKAASAPVSQPAVVTPRSAAPTQPQSRARSTELETRRPRFRRSLDNHESAPASAPAVLAQAKTASEPASPPAVATPRSEAPTYSQPRARVEPRSPRNRRSLDNQGAVATPRSPRTPAPAQPQSYYKTPELRSREGRFSRLFSNHEPVTAPARPAPAPLSQPTPAPTRAAAASVQAPNSQYRYHSPYSPRFNHNYSNNYNYNYNYNYNHYQSSKSQSLNYK
ncbi:transglutaminase domain-containing protein [Streptococcus halichoeri]|uniref:transglutaminase domain-containing protein n=1 Tax=Streptococcus halichoeri TaxID=254785 RepID=UPI001C8D48D2|nr:transglutaminase domain-containing protein [Streptococcus halichoeri]